MMYWGFELVNEFWKLELLCNGFCLCDLCFCVLSEKCKM